jgi:hypothetical protein
VPPPPVCGALVGGEAEVGVGVGDCVAVLDDVAWAEELAAALVVLPVAVPLAELADVDGKWVGSDVDEDRVDVQPATATEARMARTPKRMMVSFALSTAPAMVIRTVM